MALNVAVVLSTSSVVTEQPSQATLVIYNPGAVAVSVTGVQITGTPLGASNQSIPMPPSVPAIGPGQTTLVPASGSITIGPLPVVYHSASNASSFQAVGPAAPTSNPTQASNPVNPQGTQPMQVQISVGAVVAGSDGSQNIAAPATLTISYMQTPPLGSQGGFLQFALPTNSLGLTPGWP